MKVRSIPIMVGAVVALGGVLFFTTRPKPLPPPEPRPYVWSVEMDELAAMKIGLPRDGKSEAWVKHEDHYWYFDEPNGPMVDLKRWGGGIPLLMSGPGANRRITEHATDKQLEQYGLADPRMRIDLALENGQTIAVEAGDSTPDGRACYLRLAGATDVYTVDSTWYGVLERLVLDPPYPGS